MGHHLLRLWRQFVEGSVDQLRRTDAGIGYSVDFAQGPHGYNSWAGTLLPNVGIAPITPGFGEMLKGFLGVADDAMAYRFCE